MSESTSPPPGEKRHLWDDPRNVRRLIRGFLIFCALILALDLFVRRHLSFEHGELPVEGWFGFYAFYGFACCVLLVLAAKQLRKLLRRDEDYYDH
jgi:hypothetical protein